MAELACVAGGAALGGVCRHLLSTAAQGRGAQPWGTSAINVGGSFLLGAVTALAPVKDSRSRLLLGTGFCGGFTTFSTFSVEAMTLINAGQFGRAGAYMVASNVLSVGAAGAGLFCGTLLSRRGARLR
jgi:CrcB protein